MIVRYEGPRGGPGMRNARPTSYIKSKGLGKPVRWSLTGAFQRHFWPIAWPRVTRSRIGGRHQLVENGDIIEIDIPTAVSTSLSDEELAAAALRWKRVATRPGSRPKCARVGSALKVYAKMVTSADKGAVPGFVAAGLATESIDLV